MLKIIFFGYFDYIVYKVNGAIENESDRAGSVNDNSRKTRADMEHYRRLEV